MKRSRSVKLVEVVGESEKIQDAREGLVALQVSGDTTEPEHLLVAEESYGHEDTTDEVNIMFLTVLRDATLARRRVNTRNNLLG